MSAKHLISIVGQTALGKTELAIALAKHYDTEIISSDSRQFFKEMTIGTAVPTDEELQAAPHHFIQHKSIFEKYSVGDFEREGLALLDKLFKANDLVILVGGSGLYTDAITKGLDVFPKVSSKIREELNQRLKNEGIESLRAQLKKLDSKQYENIDLNNPHRLIRALEICIETGKPYSSFLNKKNRTRPFEVVTIGLSAAREVVYERIDRRVDSMVGQGLLDEARSLHEHKDLNALQTVGYKELFKHFEGEWEYDFAISEIKKNTRRFAKRQKTWFKKNESTHWVDYQYDIHEIFQEIQNRINA